MNKLFRTLTAACIFILAACGDNSGPTVVGIDHRIDVDNTKNITQMIADGHYDEISGDIAKLFEISGGGKQDRVMALILFNRPISSENAIAEMRDRGFRAANLEECLAYGAAITKFRQIFDLNPPHYWIVCLGQSINHDNARVVPVLKGNAESWELGLRVWRFNWSSYRRFLVVRD